VVGVDVVYHISLPHSNSLAVGTAEALKCAEDTEYRTSASSAPTAASVVLRPTQKKATEGIAFLQWL
jgi:hypothetical protein